MDTWRLRASPPVVLGMWSCTLKIGWRKVNRCLFGSGNWFLPCMCAQVAEAGKKLCKAMAPAREECNKYWLLLPAFDSSIIMIGRGGLLLVVLTSSIIMIGRGGLLLVVPTYMQSQFQFYGWGCKNLNNWTWMWEIFFAGSYNEHRSDALNKSK